MSFSYLVYIGLFLCKMKFAKTLILDFLEEIVPEKFFDEGVFEGFARSVRGGQSVDITRVKQLGRKTCYYVLGGGWWSNGGTVTGRSTSRRRGGRWVPNFGSLQPCRLGLWGGRPRVGFGHHRRSSGDGNKRRVVVVEALVSKCFCAFTSSMEDDGLDWMV